MTAITYVTHNEFGLQLEAIESRMDCRVQNIEHNVKHITDKIDNLQSAVDIQKTDSAIIKTEINNFKNHLATKAEVAAVRTDMANMETRLIKWMISTALASAALTTSIGFGLAKLFIAA
jgi:hypothetical protein